MAKKDARLLRAERAGFEAVAKGAATFRSGAIKELARIERLDDPAPEDLEHRDRLIIWLAAIERSLQAIARMGKDPRG